MDKNLHSAEGISLKEYVNDKIDNLEKSIDTRFESVIQSTKSALNAADKATTKAEDASDKRFESVNEFRQTLSDQATKFVVRGEFTLIVDRMEKDIKNLIVAKEQFVSREVFRASCSDIQKQLEDLKLSRAELRGKASQSSVNVSYLISAIGLSIAIVSLLLKVL